MKFTDFKAAYHARTIPDVISVHANQPVELTNDYDAVRRAIDHVQ